jgi:hypothetical protein
MSIKMSVADVADRYTILKLKNERLGAVYDLEYYKSVLPAAIDDVVEKLYSVNGRIWDLESDIRKGKEGELGLEEVGRRALLIRDWNHIRIGLKNIIAERLGEEIEIKGNHASS